MSRNRLIVLVAVAVAALVVVCCAILGVFGVLGALLTPTDLDTTVAAPTPVEVSKPLPPRPSPAPSSAPTAAPTSQPAPTATSAPSAPTATVEPTLAFETAEVVEVVDGDTIKVNLNRETVNVRYIEIDTPETVDPNRPTQYFGAQTSSRNAELVEGQTVRLEKDTSDRDRFGRLLRYVYVGDLMVNEVLVRERFAVKSHCLPDTKYERRFHDAEQAAKDEGAGLWAHAEYLGEVAGCGEAIATPPVPVPQPTTQQN